MINADSIFPHFMMCRLPAGFAGLLIAAVFAAAMSTLASNINSISTAFTEDLIGPIIKTASNKTRMTIARLSGFVAGSLGIGIALLLASADIYSLWDQFNLFLGFFTSGLGGLFLMGIFTKHINTKGALCGFFGSMLVVMVLNRYTHISFLLYGFVGLVSCFVIGYLLSYCFKK
jgi:Na+/proline symporter